jgi:hypothetical protein
LCELSHFSEMCTRELVQETTGTVTVVDDSRHGLSDGDYVRFIEATPLIRPLLQRHTSFCCRESTRTAGHGSTLHTASCCCEGRPCAQVQGMHEINEQPAQPIKVTGPYTFQVGDTRKLSAYVRGGYAIQVRRPPYSWPRHSVLAPTHSPPLVNVYACAAGLSNAVSLPDRRTSQRRTSQRRWAHPRANRS